MIDDMYDSLKSIRVILLSRVQSYLCNCNVLFYYSSNFVQEKIPVLNLCSDV
jgi:hypothetical protein